MPPVFILGAGVGAEARPTAGSIRGTSIYIGEYEIECGYPLVQDLPAICFPDADPPVVPEEVEDRLAEAISAGDLDPLDRLCDELQKADYYLAPRLCGASGLENPYRAFFSTYADSDFINFNYDAFVEFALFRCGSWSPDGGFGVEVGFEVGFSAEPFDVSTSRSMVLHPHGSLLVYESPFSFGRPDEGGVRWMRRHDPADFVFDPHALGNLFHPYRRVGAGLSYDPDLSNRVVAPVPHKAQGLKRDFSVAVMRQAVELLEEKGVATAIGYSFSPTDEDSWGPLVDAIMGHTSPRLTVVAPDASSIVERLAAWGDHDAFVPYDLGFSDWMNLGSPGIPVR